MMGGMYTLNKYFAERRGKLYEATKRSTNPDTEW